MEFTALFSFSLLLLGVVSQVITDGELAVCGFPGLPHGAILQPSGRLAFSAGETVSYSWENLAVMKPGVLPDSGNHINFAPTLAVDGDLNTCTYTPATTEQRYWQLQVAHTVIESVAVSITPSSHQQFTIFVIELVGSKALYKPCATFKGNFNESLAMFLCNGGKGHSGEFVYIRDDREVTASVEYFSLCEVQIFGMEESPDCGRPEQPLGSLVTVEESGQVAGLTCQEGWLAGEDREDLSLSCRKGRWEGTLPVCREIECPDPISPKSGYIEVSNFKGRYQFGSVATYRCNPGYILWGNDSRLCSSAGTWSGLTPSCRPISCGPPPSLHSHSVMQLVNKTTSWMAVAAYKCLPGYTDSDNKTGAHSTCLTDGTWSRASLNCVYDPTTLAGSAVSWNLVESLRYNLMTVIIIGVCGVMFFISLIVAVIVISHRVMSTSPPAPDLEGKHSPASHHHLLYDQIGLVEEDDYNNLYDSNSLVGDVYGKVGVIVYDDLHHPHLVETDPGSILAIRSPGAPSSLAREKDRLSLSEERSSGDGGSDKGGHSHSQYDKLIPGPQYATVGRRVRTEDIYTSLRRPDGESDESEEQFYESINKTREEERDRSLSSEASSLSQATVRLARSGQASNNSSTNNLYAKVDVKMKKKVNQNITSPLEDRKDIPPAGPSY